MNGIVIVLYTLVIVVSLLLIALILVQQPKSGGFGSTFGGLGESVFGAHAIGHMTKLTVIFTTIFFVLTLTLAIVISHMPNRKSVAGTVQVDIPAKPAGDAAAEPEPVPVAPAAAATEAAATEAAEQK